MKVKLITRLRGSIPTADEWVAGMDTGITQVHRLTNMTAAEHAVQLAMQRVRIGRLTAAYISHDDGCPCTTDHVDSSSCSCQIVDLVTERVTHKDDS